MSKIHLVIPDPHAHADFNNDRADLLSKLILELKPDVVINMGDCFDMPSLSSYDQGKRSFQGKSYAADIAAGCEFQERIWGPVRRRKKKIPLRVVLEGNHEHRIEKALDASPELEGTISFKDYQFDLFNDEVVRYNGLYPGSTVIDGIHYAHYFVSGIKGLPISGTHPSYTLGVKRHVSSTVGHSHYLDYNIQPSPNGWIQSLVAGWCGDYNSPWAGQSQANWWDGVVIKTNVENGHYDPMFVSLKQLRERFSVV